MFSALYRIWNFVLSALTGSLFRNSNPQRPRLLDNDEKEFDFKISGEIPNDIVGLNEDIQIFFKKEYDKLKKHIDSHEEIEAKKRISHIGYLGIQLCALTTALFNKKMDDHYILFARTLYKYLNHFLQLMATSKFDLAKDRSNFCSMLCDLSAKFMLFSLRHSEFNKGIAFYNQACKKLSELEKNPKTQEGIANLQCIANLHLIYAEIKLAQGDVKSAKEAFQKAKKILDNLKGIYCSRYIAVCNIFSDFYQKNGNYFQALNWYNVSLKHNPSLKTTDDLITIYNYQKAHQEQIAQLIHSKKSEIYNLSIHENKIIIQLDKGFFNKKASALINKKDSLTNLKGDISLDSAQKQIQIDIFSVSLKTLQSNLEIIEDEFHKYSNKITDMKKTKEAAKVEPNKVNIITEAKNIKKDAAINQSKKETDESKHASRKNREIEEPRAKTDSKKETRQESNKTNKSNEQVVKKAQISLAEELGVPEEFKGKKLFNLSNNYIPKGTYIGFFDKEKVLREASKLKISPDVVRQHKELAKRGDIGNGIKTDTNAENQPFKTWIPVYGPSSCRVYATVVGKFRAKTGKMVTIVSFDTLRTHEEQDKMYKRKL